MEIAELLAKWDSGDGKPYKGSLIDWQAYKADPENIGCMCAQGQVLALYGGWTPERIHKIAGQSVADKETAKLLNISRAHAILLRNVNDKAEGAPSIVLTNPGTVLGDQWSKLLDFWWAFDQFGAADWERVAAAGDAAGDAARAAAWAAAGEIQGIEVLTSRGRDVFFLPMFGWGSPADIPARPASYGNGVVPNSPLHTQGDK
jgi:hypothetical protein